MSSVLHKIAAQVLVRVEERKKILPMVELKRQITHSRKPRSLRKELEKPGIRIISEIKFASPSQGAILSEGKVSAVETARQYLDAGAAALSILTEQDYFHGNPEYLRQVRKAHPEAVILMKDFVLESYQLYEALHWGADAVLLIVALLGEAQTQRLYNEAQELGLSVLVEVHDTAELEIALKIGAKIIGVNNRDLKTLKVDLKTSHALVKHVHDSDVCLVSESGIEAPADLEALKKSGFHAFLIGSSFMKTGEPGRALQALIGAVK